MKITSPQNRLPSDGDVKRTPQDVPPLMRLTLIVVPVANVLPPDVSVSTPDEADTVADAPSDSRDPFTVYAPLVLNVTLDGEPNRLSLTRIMPSEAACAPSLRQSETTFSSSKSASIRLNVLFINLYPVCDRKTIGIGPPVCIAIT